MQMEVGGVWRSRRAGIVKRTTKKRVVERPDFRESIGFLDLAKAILIEKAMIWFGFF